MTRVYFSMAIEASIAHVLRDKFEGHQFWIIFDCLVFFFFFFFNFLTSTYVESYFTSWKFPTLAICLIIYKWNLTFQRTFRHYFENSTPWMLPAHTWNEEKKKVEVCLSRKTYSHHHNKCSWKESYARFFISLNLLSGVKHSFFIIPNSIYSSYNLS